MERADCDRLADYQTRPWDVLIAGTGMGGATLGYSLARTGLRVLFLEKGRSHIGRPGLQGDYAENFFPTVKAAGPEHRDVLARAGRCSEEVEDVSNGRPRRFVPFIGAGTGGSTALYGMAMERLFPVDFTPRQNHPRAVNAALPEGWPVSYEELWPYYEAASGAGQVDPGPARRVRGGTTASSSGSARYP